MTEHINWMIVRNNNAFLVKKRNIKKPFSKEPNNLTNLSSFRYSGLVRRKTVGIEGPKASEKKGFTLVLKKTKKDHRPAKSVIKCEMKAGPRRSLYKLKKVLMKSKYRRDLAMAALRRASAVLRSQRALPVKKPRTKKTE